MDIVDFSGDAYEIITLAGNCGTPNADVSGPRDNGDGVHITTGAQHNRIGTDGDGVLDTDERNVISGNTLDQVTINGAGANNNVVAGNFIGTTTNGTGGFASPLAVGVSIGNGAQGNIIGTDGSNDAFNANERNVIVQQGE